MISVLDLSCFWNYNLFNFQREMNNYSEESSSFDLAKDLALSSSASSVRFFPYLLIFVQIYFKCLRWDIECKLLAFLESKSLEGCIGCRTRSARYHRWLQWHTKWRLQWQKKWRLQWQKKWRWTKWWWRWQWQWCSSRYCFKENFQFKIVEISYSSYKFKKTAMPDLFKNILLGRCVSESSKTCP